MRAHHGELLQIKKGNKNPAIATWALVVYETRPLLPPAYSAQ